MKALFLVDQPWQLKLTENLIKEIQKLEINIEPHIAIVDIFTFLHAPEQVSKVSKNLNIKIYTLEQQYKKWQTNNHDLNAQDENYLKRWEKKYCRSRTLEELEKCNQWIYGFENNSFYKRTSVEWNRRFLLDSIQWCEEIIDNEHFEVIFSIERATLPVNIFWTISQKSGTKFLTLFHSRIGQKWLIQDNFGYGTSDLVQLKINSHEYSAQSDLADKFLTQFNEKKIGSYESFELRIDASRYLTLATSISEIWVAFRRLGGRVWSRIFYERKHVKIKIKRFEQNLIKLSFFDLKVVVYNLLIRLGVLKIGVSPDYESKYFLWALHARPEGSVQALSKGQDEIEILKRVALSLPKGVLLFVKENTLMLGRRNIVFYHELSKLKNVRVVGISENTYQLIKNSQGVLGLTGTVLLEAAILKKPAFTFGSPEFEELIYSSKRMQPKDFISATLTNQLPTISNSVYGYINYCLKEGIEAPLYDFDEFTHGDALQSVQQIANRLRSELNNSGIIGI
jgi:hypothetical protein